MGDDPMRNAGKYAAPRKKRRGIPVLLTVLIFLCLVAVFLSAGGMRFFAVRSGDSNTTINEQEQTKAAEVTEPEYHWQTFQSNSSHCNHQPI